MVSLNISMADFDKMTKDGWVPYFLTDTVVVGASSAATARLAMGGNERFIGFKLGFMYTSASLDIRGIKDDSGTPYTNASADNPIPMGFFPGQATSNVTPYTEFELPVEISALNAINIELTDTSASSNTVRIVFFGMRKPSAT